MALPRLRRLALWLFVLFALCQLVPYGHRHVNPPVVAEPAWDAPGTRALAKRACFDCHSNETVWPLYAYVAPVSWLVLSDVESGRRHLNFSEWNLPQKHFEDAAEIVRSKDMPLQKYLILHRSARLTDAERDQLADGFARMFAGKEK